MKIEFELGSLSGPTLTGLAESFGQIGAELQRRRPRRRSDSASSELAAAIQDLVQDWEAVSIHASGLFFAAIADVLEDEQLRRRRERRGETAAPVDAFDVPELEPLAARVLAVHMRDAERRYLDSRRKKLPFTQERTWYFTAAQFCGRVASALETAAGG